MKPQMKTGIDRRGAEAQSGGSESAGRRLVRPGRVAIPEPFRIVQGLVELVPPRNPIRVNPAESDL